MVFFYLFEIVTTNAMISFDWFLYNVVLQRIRYSIVDWYESKPSNKYSQYFCAIKLKYFFV